MISISAIFENADVARKAMHALENAGYGSSRVNIIGAARTDTGGVPAMNADTDVEHRHDADGINDAGIAAADVIAPGPLATGMASTGAGMGAGSGVIMGGFIPPAVHMFDGDMHSGDADNSVALNDDNDDLGRGNVTLSVQALDMDDMKRAQDLMMTFNPLRMEETE